MTTTLIVGLLVVVLGLGRHNIQPDHVVDALPIINKTICSMPMPEFGPLIANHAYYAATYFAPLYPNIQWSAKYLGQWPGQPADLVRGWVLNGGDCDILIGPGASSRAVAMSPLVTVPWVDPSATSTELSDKARHPVFSRVIPTDEIGAKGAGLVYKAFGWNRTNILCTDEPYGRSVANGVSNVLRANGGFTDVTICLENTASFERVADALESYYQSNTRIIMVAADRGSMLEHFAKEVKRRNATNDFIFFFSEFACPAMEEWPGSLCATYRSDDAYVEQFLLGYKSRDISQERLALNNLGYPNTTDINSSSHIFGHFAMDATHHAMSAVHAHYLNNSYGDVIDFLRSHTSQGSTGTVTMDSNGDRNVVDMAVFNTGVDGKYKAVGVIKSEVFQYTDTSFQQTLTRPDLFLYNRTYTSTDTLPMVETDGSGHTVVVVDTTDVGLIVAITVGAAVLLIVLVGGPIAFVLFNAGRRDVSCAPTDQTKPFAIVFTDVQSSTALWARLPVLMSQALDAHHAIIRRQLSKCRGYEVKTIGDSFMCAFEKVEDAVNFGNMVQERLYVHDWEDSNEFEFAYKQFMSESETGSIFEGNGLRVRIGINFGEGTITLDEVTKAYDYYGTVVNTAARVESVGHGGQCLITDAALAALDSSVRSTLHIVDLGPQALRGLDEGIRLHQVCPSNHEGLVQRKFPQLRLEKALDLDVGDETRSNASGRSASASMASNDSHSFVLENLAMKHAKRNGYAGDPAMVDRLLDLQQYTRILLSTSDKSYREKMMQHFCSKWRVTIGAGTSKGDLKSELAYQTTILDIANKVMGVRDAQKARGSRHHNGGVLLGAKAPRQLGGSQNEFPLHDDLEVGPPTFNPNPLRGDSVPEHTDDSGASHTPSGGGIVKEPPTGSDIEIRSCDTTPEPQ